MYHVKTMSNEVGTRVASSALEFKMTPDVLDAFVANNTVDLERHSDFLDPDKRRYLVVSIDPAGGGEESEEAFIVFLCVGSTMGLLGGRVVNGRKPNHHFSTIPLSFVLALLDTVRMAQQTLQTAHARSKFAAAKGFVMPTVLVVLETNFAYGAAVYMQMLYMIQTRQNADPSLRTVDILFATPVYSSDRETMSLRQRLSERTLRRSLL